MSPIIALISDFGTADSFVGQMKCVILSISPNAKIVDISHQVEFANIRHADYFVESSEKFLPPETVLVVVIDPGVGSSRKIIACKTNSNIFIAPDNGCLTSILKKYPKSEIRSIENKRFCLPEISSTFHGRDIFAPAAAHLSNGRDFSAIGPIMPNPILLPDIPCQISADRITFSVRHIDRFGNIITNIPITAAFDKSAVWQFPGNDTLIKSYPTFTEIEPGCLGIIPGSSGYYELALYLSSAAKKLALPIGSVCELISR